MLGLLISKEIRVHVLSYRFVLTFLLFFVLVVSSVQIIALNYDRQQANYSEGQRAQEEKLKESTDFRSLRWGGTKVERRPNPLSVFAMGLEKEMSRSLTISQFREAKLGRSKYANPLFVRSLPRTCSTSSTSSPVSWPCSSPLTRSAVKAKKAPSN